MNKIMKNSCIDWIGEIPEYWEVKRIKDVLNLKSGSFIDKSKENGFYDIFGANGVIGKTNKKNIKNNTILIGRVGFAGAINLVSDGFASDNTLIVNFKNKTNTKYFYYLLSIFKFEDIVSKTSHPLLVSSKLLNAFIVTPNSLIQKNKICNFLDQETSKIDKKISNLEQTLEKLEEYKQSVIFEIVTKGLDSNVPMKDSEIDWIGDIPAHWEVKRVKEISKWQTGFTPDTKNLEYYKGYNDWITIGDMDGKYIKKSKNKINGSMFPKKWITPVNSLLFSFKLSIGQVSFNEKEVFTNEAICSFSPKSDVNLKYFYYAAPVFIVRNAKKNIYGADLLNQELISNANVLFFTQEEQEKIAQHLDNICSKIDKKKENIAMRIELLKEYKQSLIYEAVTGKLDIK